VARAAVSAFGRIEILVNNAGRGLLGAVEEASPDEVEAVFQTNVFGLLAVTRAVLPVMRAQRSGRILNLSSMGGFAQVAGWGVYGATKFAVEGCPRRCGPRWSRSASRWSSSNRAASARTSSTAAPCRRASQVIDDYAATTGQLRGGDPA
jgi:NAD(P)-dependent dehydrogenase (short-subunit alcohol dehydrogenase family)